MEASLFAHPIMSVADTTSFLRMPPIIAFAILPSPINPSFMSIPSFLFFIWRSNHFCTTTHTCASHSYSVLTKCRFLKQPPRTSKELLPQPHSAIPASPAWESVCIHLPALLSLPLIRFPRFRSERPPLLHSPVPGRISFL